MTSGRFALLPILGCVTACSAALACGERDLASRASPASQPECTAAQPDAQHELSDRWWDDCRIASDFPKVTVRAKQPAIEPTAFFERLVQRYKGLHFYRDTARIVHTTHRSGEETSRLETEIGCEFRDGGLSVQTPTSMATSVVGFDMPVRTSQAAQAFSRGYDLWLAPHMTLKVADEPLKTFRSGVEEGFTPTEAEHITIDDREMLHVELRSGDGLSESCTAKFDLFINPQTMLVERIDGEQHLPDGARCTTSVHITPHDFQNEPARE